MGSKYYEVNKKGQHHLLTYICLQIYIGCQTWMKIFWWVSLFNFIILIIITWLWRLKATSAREKHATATTTETYSQIYIHWYMLYSFLCLSLFCLLFLICIFLPSPILLLSHVPLIFEQMDHRYSFVGTYFAHWCLHTYSDHTLVRHSALNSTLLSFSVSSQLSLLMPHPIHFFWIKCLIELPLPNLVFQYTTYTLQLPSSNSHPFWISRCHYFLTSRVMHVLSHYVFACKLFPSLSLSLSPPSDSQVRAQSN